MCTICLTHTYYKQFEASSSSFINPKLLSVKRILMAKHESIRITCRTVNGSWNQGIPPSPGSLWPGPVVVVMVPLVVRSWWQSALNNEERSRIAAIRAPRARMEKLAAHVLARVVLSRIDGSHPSNHGFSRDHFGRPTPCRLSEWSCSLSHDSSGVAVAVGAGSERNVQLGVDICRPLADHSGLSFVWHEREIESLHLKKSFHPETKAVYWASKEALLKRWGWGLIPTINRISTVPGQTYHATFEAPSNAKPATSSIVTSRVLNHGVAVALAHDHDQVPTWFITNAAELDNAVLDS
jgi:phosphopantetheinyl transferase